MNKITCSKCGASGDPAQAQPGSAPDTVLCPYCGGDISTLADQAPPLPDTWRTAEIVPPPPPDPSEYIPWEAEGPFLFRLWQTIKLVLFHPVQALSRPALPGYTKLVNFAVLTGTPATILNCLWKLIFYSEASLPGGHGLQVWYMILSPLSSVIGLFLFSGFLHLFIMLGKANRKGFSATLRVYAYCYAAGVFCLIPIVGEFVGSIWAIVIMVGGLSGAHGISIGRVVWATLILPLLVLLGLGVLIGVSVAVLGS